jgi:YVTN family beta-propeller protein
MKKTILITFLLCLCLLVGSVSAGGTYAYVTNYGGTTVSVIDTSTNTVSATVTGLNVPQGVAINPAGTYAYVTNYGINTVSVINTSTNTVSATVTVGSGPVNVAINPAGTYAYVTNYGSSTVSVINTSTNTVSATVTVGTHPIGVAINPAGTYAYVANVGSSTVSVIDTSTNTVSATVTGLNAPQGVAINPAGTYAYVTNVGINTVSVINTSTNTVSATVTGLNAPQGVAINPAGTYAYVTNNGGTTVSVINTSTNTVSATVTVGSGPVNVAINPAGTYAYVTNYGGTTVSVIDTSTNTVSATVTVGTHPVGVAITPGYSPISSFTVNQTAGTSPLAVSFTDTSTGTPTSWNWSYRGIAAGNNTQTWFSTIRNATTSFTTGNYTIVLNASNSNGYNISTQITWINVTSNVIVLSSNFTQNQTTGYQYPMPVSFTDTSTGSPATWNYTFGDTYASTLQNPTHIYTVANNYTVTQNVTNATGEYSTSIKYINLTTDDDIYLTSRLHMNGTQGSSSFIDQKGLEWTAANGAITTTSTYFGGGSSGDFTPALSQITSPSQSAFNFGTGPFTIEMWANPTSTMASSQIIARTSVAGLTDGWGMYQTTGTLSNTWHFYMGNATSGSTSAFTIPLGSWSNVVATRDNFGNVKVYVNGTLAATATGLTGNYDTNNPVTIGSYGALNTYNGYLDEVSISKIQRFTGNFSPQYAQYNGNLFWSYPNINPNTTLRYKSDPSPGVTIGNQTNGGVRIRTMQIQNVTNATSIFGQMTYDPLHVMVLNVTTNTSTYGDLVLSSSFIDNVQGLISFNVTRTAGMDSLFDNRTSILNAAMLYYNYSATNSDDQAFANGQITDGQHNVTYPIFYYINTPVYYEPWVIGANFTSNVTTVTQNQHVQFNDTSSGYPTMWSWDFGDGSTSTAQNPVYAYTATGLKTITLTSSLVTNASITNTTIKTNYINVTAAPPPAPVADFTGTPITVSLGTTVQFNDTSAYSPTSWSWNFGDSGGSSLQNPTHLYTSIGVYNVSLTATNAQGSSTATKTNYINVTALAPPVAAFISNVSSGGIPLAVAFTDTSSNVPTSWLWTFSDDASTSTGQNPTHTFTTQGNWSISLKATNAAGNNTITHYINATTLSGFTRQDLVLSIQHTLTINFVDSSTNLAIPVVKVVNAADGTSVNTTTGAYTGTFGYTTAVLYCYSDGYQAKSVSYVMSSDKTETVQLTESSATVIQNTNVVYSPTMVQFLFYNENLKVISNAYVIATPINFTAPSNWTSLLLGISPGCSILGTSVYGWTDIAGSWSAPMIASVDYSMTVSGTESGTPFNYTFTIYPVQSPVHITLPIGITEMPTQSQISYGLNHTAVNTTLQTVVMNYYDPSGETTILNFYVTNTTGALLASGNYTGSSANSASFYRNITVATRGQAYSYGFNAKQGTLGWINRSDSFVDPSFSLLGSGFTPGVVELWFSIALLVIFGAVGSFYFKHIILIAEPILYWFIASYLSWLPLNTKVCFSLAVMVVFGALIYIRYRENLIQ